MSQLIHRINSQKSPVRRLRRFDWVDALGLFTVIGCACLGAIVTPLQVAQHRWEQAAKQEFYARTPHPVVVPPLFDFPGRERFINGVAGGLFSLVVEMILIASSRAVARVVDTRLVGVDRGQAEVARELQAIRQNLNRLADTRQRPPQLIEPTPIPSHSPPPAEEDVGAEHLRASAEACFRLAQGAVSRSLAEELEALGREFEREAAELEK
jgi:hypothetical protein